MKKLFLALVFVALISPNVFAFSVSAPSYTISVPILATKEIKISVSSDTTDTIAVNLIEPKTWVTLGESQITVPGGGSKDISIFISPMISTPQVIYRTSILFESVITKELKKADIFISVEKGELVTIDKIVVTGALQPLGSAKIEFHVKNYKTVTVQDAQLTATVSSPLKTIGTIDREIQRMDPGQEAVVDATVFFDRYAPAGTYTVDANLMSGTSIFPLEQTFRVERTSVITKEAERFSVAFGFGRRLTVTNNGNEAGDATHTEVFSGFDSVFFSGTEPTSKSDGYYTWLLSSMQPGETRTIEYKVDYTPLFLFIIALIVGGWLYFSKFRTVRIKKYVIQKKRIAEGEEFTVAVEIINSIGRKVDVEVHDFVPAVFDVRHAEGLRAGTKKSQIGTELVWHAKNLNPKESRVFSYKIVPIFGVHGTISLPKASAVFEYNKKKWESRSFSTVLGLPPETNVDQALWKKFFSRKK